MMNNRENSSSRFSTWLFLITFSLIFYGMGASFVESFVNYPTWKLIGSAEFRAFHQTLGPLIVGFMVIPLIIATVLTILLLWFRPVSIPPWMLWLSLALQIVVWISTALFQLPIQFELSNTGLSIDAVDQLIYTNLWFRRVPALLNNVLFLWMMSRLLRTHYSEDADASHRT